MTVTTYTGTDKCTYAYDDSTHTLTISGISGHSYSLREGVIAVSGDTYVDVSDMEHCVISESVQKITGRGYPDPSSFKNCTHLESISLPSTLLFIGSSDNSSIGTEFVGCTSLSNITVAQGNPYFAAEDNVLYYKDGNAMVYYPGGKTNVQYTIPSSVSGIGIHYIRYGAFGPNSHLSVLTIPSSIISIKDTNMNVSLSNLSYVNVDSNNTKYFSDGSGALYEKLTDYDPIKYVLCFVPPKCNAQNYTLLLDTFREGTAFKHFYGCLHIRTITLAPNMTREWDGFTPSSFIGCTSLTDIFVASGDTSGIYISDNGVLYQRISQNITLRKYPCAKSGSTYSIMGGTTSLSGIFETGAFYDNSNLTTISFPSTITAIDGRALPHDVSELNLLLNSTTPPTVNAIAFPQNIITNAFVDPDALSSYASHAVWGDNTIVNLSGSYTDSNGNLYYLGGTTLHVLKSSGSGVMPSFTNNVSDIATVLSNATAVDIAGGMSAIGDKSFNGIAITSASIPSSITSIGTNAFNVSSPQNLTLNFVGTTPPTLSSGAIPSSIGHIYVPQQALSAYISGYSDLASKVYSHVQIQITHSDDISSTMSSGTYDVGQNGVSVTFTYVGSSVMKELKTPDVILTGYSVAHTYNNGVVSVPVTSFTRDGTLSMNAVSGYMTYYDSNNNEYYIDDTYSGDGRYVLTVTKGTSGTGVIPNYSASNQNVFTDLSILPQLAAYITDIDIQSTITKIGEGAFKYCNSGSPIASAPVVRISTNGEICDKAFYNCTDVENVTIRFASSIDTKRIGSLAFWACTELRSVSVPGTISSMGEYVFNGCTALTTLAWPANMASIPRGTFKGCTSYHIFALDNISRVYDEAFESVPYTYLQIPNAMYTIGSGAFNDHRSDEAHEIYVGRSTPAELVKYDEDQHQYVPATYTDCFGQANDNLIIYVDSSNAAVSDYMDAWPQYSNCIRAYNEDYVITFHKNAANAVGTMEDFTATRGISATLPYNMFLRPEHAMYGWGLTDDATQEDIDDGEGYLDGGTILIPISSGIRKLDLYAVWIDFYSYTVTFDPMGGRIVSGQAIVVTNQSGYVESFPKVIRNGYVFDGWYKSPLYTEVFTSSTPVREGNITVYAKWRDIEYSDANKCTLTRYDKKKDGTLVKTEIIMPYVKSITDTYSASLTTLDTIVYGYKNKFVMDLGTQEKYTFYFERIPVSDVDDESDDPAKWSNGLWFSKLIEFVNYWQNFGRDMDGEQSGGMRLQFTPGASYSNLYPQIDKNVFVCGSISTDHGNPQTLQKLSFSMTFAVGSMRKVKDGAALWRVNFTNIEREGSTWRPKKEASQTITYSSPYGINMSVPEVPKNWEVPKDGYGDDMMLSYWTTAAAYSQNEPKVLIGSTMSQGDYSDVTLYPRWVSPSFRHAYTSTPGYNIPLTTVIPTLVPGDAINMRIIVVGGGGSGGNGGSWAALITPRYHNVGGGGGSGQMIDVSRRILYDATEVPTMTIEVGKGGARPPSGGGGRSGGRSSFRLYRGSDGTSYNGLSLYAQGGSGGGISSKEEVRDNGGSKYTKGGRSGGGVPIGNSSYDLDGNSGSGKNGGRGHKGDTSWGPLYLHDVYYGGGGGGAADLDIKVNGRQYTSRGGNGGRSDSGDDPGNGVYGGGGGGVAYNSNPHSPPDNGGNGGSGIVIVMMEVIH